MNQNIAPRSFFQHKRVWVVFVVTLILALYVSKQIINADKLEFIKSFGSTNAQLFMDSFKLPIGIIAAGLSVLLLFATQHRSEQTAEQIKLSLAQNTLRNYYDSIADFEKYIKESYHSNVLEIKNKRQLYKLFFPKNSHTSVCPYTTIEIYKKNVNRFLEEVNENIKTNKKNNENVAEVLESIINNFISMSKIRYGVNIKSDAFSPLGSTPLKDYLKVTDDIRNLLTFCMEYTPSNGIVVIGNSRVCNLSEWIDFDNEKNDLNSISYSATLEDKISLRLPNKRIMFDKTS